MTTSLPVYSNFYSRFDLIKAVGISHGKSLLIDCLRDVFRDDSIYKYREDEYGFPLIIDPFQTTPEEGGLGVDIDSNLIPEQELSTKILITSAFRNDVKFYPVVTVRQVGGKDHPLSFNQNIGTVHYRKEYIRDGYGNQIPIRTPTHLLTTDSWDQQFEIKVVAESLADRDDIVDIIIHSLRLKREELRRAGLFIQSISMGGESEEENLKAPTKTLYNYTITVSTFSEWSREIPIRSIVERINFYFDIARHGITPSGQIDILDNSLSNEAILIAVIE